MAKETKHPAYFGLKLKAADGEDSGKQDWTQFSYSRSWDGISEWAAGTKKEDVAAEPAKESEKEEAPTSERTLSGLLAKVTESSLALSELVVASSAIKGLFTSIISRVEVVDPIRKNCPLLESGDGYQIYGITEEKHQKVRDEHRRLIRMDRGFDLLPSATLLTIVATFDSHVAEVVREMLTLKPERFDSAERTIAVSDVLGMSSFEEVRSKLIDDEIYLFSRGSHEEQVKYIEKSFHIQIAKSWKKWPDFIEIFERRNLIAHGESGFTKRYAAICERHGHKGADKIVGEEIKLTMAYLGQTLDILLEFNSLLIFSLWRKQFPDQEQQAFEAINDMTYKLIGDERYRLPVNVIEYVLAIKGAKVTESVRLMLTVNLASAYKHLEEDRKSEEVLDKVDWTASSDNYKICVSALKGEIDNVVDMMDNVVRADTISKDNFREWPVFDFIRDDEKFRAKFEKIFGEAISETQPNVTVESEEEVAEQLLEADKTVH